MTFMCGRMPHQTFSAWAPSDLEVIAGACILVTTAYSAIFFICFFATCRKCRLQDVVPQYLQRPESQSFVGFGLLQGSPMSRIA